MYVPSFFWFFSLGECSGATAYSRRPPRPDRRHRHHVQQKVQSLERQASALPRCDRPNREARPGPGEPRHGMGAESRRRGFLLSWPAATLHGAGAREKPAPGSRGGPCVHAAEVHVAGRRGCVWAWTRRGLELSCRTHSSHGDGGRGWGAGYAAAANLGKGTRRPPSEFTRHPSAAKFWPCRGTPASKPQKSRIWESLWPGGVPASRDIVCVFLFFLIKSLISVF